MKIIINGFMKYNPRSDLKSMPWLRLQNNFYDLEDFYDVSKNGCWLFVFLLCQCAQKVANHIEMSENYLIHKSKLKKSDFFEALKELELKQVVKVVTIESDRTRTDSCLTNERTDITNMSDTIDEQQNQHIATNKINEIISYLNLKAEKQFKPNSAATIKIIKTRLSENFTLDNFKHVIDVKTSQWLKDKSMNVYLRPATLFGNKFEGYLNEKKQKTIEELDDELLKLIGGPNVH